jgi:CBS domain-containing protein
MAGTYYAPLFTFQRWIASRSFAAIEVINTKETITMQVQEMMTVAVECCISGDSARQAAELMWKTDAGAIPVKTSEGDSTIIGIVTDRDLCMEVVAAGRNADKVLVDECMTTQVVTCYPEDELEEVAELMAANQIRRVPVVDEQGKVMGIVSLADIALIDENDFEVADTVRTVSVSTFEPSIPRANDRSRN